MEIRKLEINDKEVVKGWRYRDEFEQFNYAFKDKGWIDSYFSECYICKKEEDILGLFFLIAQKNNEFRVLINPEFLNKGYGKKILNEAIDMAFNKLKLDEISLIVRKNHPIAINLYKSVDFKVVGETKEIIDSIEVEFFKMIKKEMK